MVVGVLTTSYPRFAGDAAGSFVGDDVRRLVRGGATVQVIAAGDGPAGVTRRSEDGVDVTRIGTGGGALFYGDGAPEALERGGVRAWITAAHFSAALRRALAVAAPGWDRIVSHWLVPCGWAAVSAAPRLPHRGYAHSGDVALLERLPFGRALAGQLAAAGADLVFVSRDLRARFAALLGRAGDRAASVGQVEQLVPRADLFPAVSAAQRAAARAHLGVSGPTVVAVGRLIPIKGFDLLVDAVGDRARLIVIGAGPEAVALRARARRRSVSLTLPGVLPRAELATWLAAADLYVQPSRALSSGRTEGVPLATLEALAVGVPVIAARTGGLAELDGPVAFFDPGDVASLRRVLLTALHIAIAR
ncbi:MAG TPA: glycosyltransferase family 4 protein [Polyangia bacterium]|nr:glycosyltransferase family 4 protein [Polyangia bacterium]